MQKGRDKVLMKAKIEKADIAEGKRQGIDERENVVPGATNSYSTVKVKVSRTGGGGLRFQRQNEWLTTVPNQASLIMDATL